MRTESPNPPPPPKKKTKAPKITGRKNSGSETKTEEKTL